MKKIFTILGFLFAISTFAQNDNGVVSALKTANVNEFTSYFNSTVDVKLPKENEKQNVSKADAANMVKSFFSSNNINGFEVISQREMSGTMYIAGKLKSTSQDYNLTVMLKNKGDGASVITVRIN
ncbi:MAG TPA: DUF4783 domain-containing protein [Parafilimonas sp.]|nr:DUF4783 domain-containing protein [Parafilimonas sp.]